MWILVQHPSIETLAFLEHSVEFPDSFLREMQDLGHMPAWTSSILDDVINEAKSASDPIIMGVKNKAKAQPTLLLDDY